MGSRFWLPDVGWPKGLAGRMWSRRLLNFRIWRGLGLFQLLLEPLGFSLWEPEPPEDTSAGGKSCLTTPVGCWAKLQLSVTSKPTHLRYCTPSANQLTRVSVQWSPAHTPNLQSCGRRFSSATMYVTGTSSCHSPPDSAL